MSIYKPVNFSNTKNTQESKVYKEYTLDSSSIQWYEFKSGSKPTAFSTTLESNVNYYQSLNTNYYLSGSDHSKEDSRFNNPAFSFSVFSTTYPIHKNKFHSIKSGSIISIPQKYWGEAIKPKSFELNQKLGTSYNFKIKDDGYGNLYATNAHISQSGTTSISSSDNYVGNIFYRHGIATITETGSFSGSFTYSQLNQISSSALNVSFKGTKTIYTAQYEVTINPHEFNTTVNPSACVLNSLGNCTGYLHSYLTSSGWTPYFNTIGFYDEGNNLVMVAKYPQNIKKRDDIPLTLKVKMDF